MTCGFLIQLVFCKKKTIWFIGVEVEQETSAPPPKQNPGSAPEEKPKPIIHRDVSSANVLLWQQGDQWRGKVSDYGTANFMQQTMTVAPGAMIYSAPEALTSNQTVKVSFSKFRIFLFSTFSSTSSDFKETRCCSDLEHVATLRPVVLLRHERNATPLYPSSPRHTIKSRQIMLNRIAPVQCGMAITLAPQALVNRW